MKRIISLIVLFFLPLFLNAGQYDVESPSKKLIVTINTDNHLTYSVSYDKVTIIKPSAISLILDRGILGIDPSIKNKSIDYVNREQRPVLRQKYAVIKDEYNELRLDFENNFSLYVRVYDEGFGYRISTRFDDSITVKDEIFEANFANDFNIFFPQEDSFMSHSERLYKYLPISKIDEKSFCSLPALVDLNNSLKVAITEADLCDYAGLYLRGTNSTVLKGLFPFYPAETEIKSDRDVYVTKRKDYIVRTNGTRNFPWRVFVISDNDGMLIENTMVYKLAQPHDPDIDFTWIKPGKVAWDWWNANNVYKVDFRAGINTATYKYYIDFASQHGIEYVILDEGWYKLGNLLEESPGINIREIVEYAREKNVGIILWVIWKTLDDQFEEAMNLFEELGIKGIKVDFMQRDDAWMVNYYYKVAKEAARRKFLVDFHGAYKPTGLYRTYPNVITSEGILGLEHNKWSNNVTPEHNVTIPFIRMLAGPMDYTPGAMNNAVKENFRDIFTQPMSQGTRCHQLAMYVIFESPLQMLADSPTNYLREKESLEFLSIVPTVWDKTKVLDAKVGDYVAIARKSGNKWFVGAMTDWSARTLKLDFSFLEDNREYKITIYQDGINADRNGNDYKVVKSTVRKGDKIEINMATGGGWVAIIE
ncbi:glycoside hydrolase family 97 protein [Melioribacter sp. OK-6-Me]|uniref:glycoside hydrolase family 97 protein n=1 Tax=unclassified Melioribacter TaxID=2627329 RepID=UPI003ED8F04E